MTKTEIIKLIKGEDLKYEGVTEFKHCTAYWFTSRKTKSTMLMKEEDISLEALRVKIKAHNKQFGVN